MKRLFTTKTIAGTGLLTAIMIVLQVIGNFVAIGPISINLSLIPIAIGAILFGPLSGLFLGLVNGVMCILAPSTLSFFMPVNPLGTVLICLIKTTFAGFFSGLFYFLLKDKNKTVGALIASLSLPIINTGLFAIGCFTFFMPILEEYASSYGNIYGFLFLGLIGWNFVFEFLTSLILSPTVIKVMEYANKSHSKKRLN